MERISRTMINVLVNKVLPSKSLLFVFLAALSSQQLIYADEHADDDNRYDGSEYNASSFQDTDFGKIDSKDLRSINSAVRADRSSTDLSHKESVGLKLKHSDKNSISEAGKSDDKGPIKNANGRVIAEERTGPTMDLPGDWVPDKLDLTSNGGFSIAPDNGSPVPYRLNGHVDIQRGRP